ncbi:Smr/MutS family protein [Sphingobium aquiterrae]|uniref:Smr/MutS family protein n=1 Tax=Sphingobium aquiterrae TaxID=2038656 RepID=UPI00301ACA77
MAARRLNPEERAAWALIARTVRRAHKDEARGASAAAAPVDTPSPPAAPKRKASAALTTSAPARPVPPPPRRPVETLDSTWEKQIRRGALQPDIAIDLHGHSLAAAHARLDQVLAEARLAGARTLLIVTGKARKFAQNGDGRGRGAIRAEIGHWLEAGRHADAIASVRTAHPRHGGDGAIYVILRRKK